MSLLNPEMIIFILASMTGILSAVLTIIHKSLTYAAFFLAILGVSNAVLMTLLGFTILAVFHIAVYIGAAVIFILFSVTLLKEPPPPTPSMTIIAGLAAATLVAGFLTVFLGVNAETYGHVSYRDIASLLISKYKFTLLITTLTLVTTLIEALTLAMRGEET